MSFKTFKNELEKKINNFDENYREVKSTIDEANLRILYIDPLFESLGWDINNKNLSPLHERAVIVEPTTSIDGRRKRPDYLFRVNGIDKFLVEAKKPSELSIDRHAFQVQNYVYNSRIWVGALTNFEYLLIYVVGAQPSKEHPFSPAPGWRLHYSEYLKNAKALWDLLSYDAVSDASIEKFAQSLEKVPKRGKQGWLIPPDRNRTIDNDFLDFLERERKKLAPILMKDNPGLTAEDTTATVQAVIDKILFQKICEDRDIDVGKRLLDSVSDWDKSKRQKNQLWHIISSNFAYMKRTLNGSIYGVKDEEKTLTDNVNVRDSWLENFIETISAEDGQYLFSVIPVQILGSVYERFLGSVIDNNGRVEFKPEHKKEGGVVYTPVEVVDLMISESVRKRIQGKRPRQIQNITIVDPACGSGTFLLKAFEEICSFYIHWFNWNPSDRSQTKCYVTRDKELRLTVGFKRHLLQQHIFGVDIDPQAVAVTQMSLYLKVLENENAESLERDQRLFPAEKHLPDLDQNIKCGNALIGTDFFQHAHEPDLIHEVNPFDWRAEFPRIFKQGGFDVVVGNPPYFNVDEVWGANDPRLEYLKSVYPHVHQDKTDAYYYFIAQSLDIARSYVCLIVSRAFMEAYKARKIRDYITRKGGPTKIIDFRDEQIFDGVGIYVSILLHDNREKQKEVQYMKYIESRRTPTQVLEDFRKDKSNFVTINVEKTELSGDVWQFYGVEEKPIVEKIDSAGDKLGGFCAVGQGMQTGANSVFEAKGLSEQLDAEDRRTWIKTRARNSDIERFYIRSDGPEIIYPVSAERFSDMPKEIRQHLQRNREKLEGRAAFKRGDCAWWSYTWPLNKEHYDKVRIICPYHAKRTSFAVDRNFDFLSLTDSTVIFCDSGTEAPEYIAGLLNSTILDFRIKGFAKLKGAGIYEFFENTIAKAPLRRIDFTKRTDVEAHGRVVEIYQILEGCKQRLVHARAKEAERRYTRILQNGLAELDDVVASLYGLTDDEKGHIRSVMT